MSAVAVDLSERQRRNAAVIYLEGRRRGLSRRRARELALASWHESNWFENAVNKSSGAAGLFQLLSEHYRRRARELGGLFDPLANTRAIIGDYVSYWRRHPRAARGAAARDVERSGEPASFYADDVEVVAWLDDSSARRLAGGTAGAASPDGGPRPRLRDFVRGDVQGSDPRLLARLWLLGAWLGEVIEVGSGYRSIEEQRAIYAAWRGGTYDVPAVAAPGTSKHNHGTAADAKIGGRNIGNVVDERTLNLFGLKSLRGIGEPWHVESVDGPSAGYVAGNTASAQPVGFWIPAIAAGLAPGILKKIAPRLRGWLGRGKGRAGGATSVAKAGALGAVLAGLGVTHPYSVKFAALWLLFVLLGLALILVGVLRLVGAAGVPRPGPSSAIVGTGGGVA